MQKISARDITNMKRFLNEAIGAPHMSFYVALFKAIRRADPENLAKLKSVFPDEVALYERWKTFGMDISGPEQDFGINPDRAS
jgi:hypothetical protein